MNRAWRPLPVAGIAALLAMPLAAQQPPPDPLAQVDELLKQAQAEIGAFEKGGGGKRDPEHPVAGWVDRLWEIRDGHPGTPAAAKATTEAIHLLVHAERIQDAERRADGLAADDPAWETLARVLVEAAAHTNDYRFAATKLEAVAARLGGAGPRSRVHYHLGRARAKAERGDAARAAFQAALRDAAGTPFAKEVEATLYELEKLGCGHPAPAFAGTARDGKRVALEDYRGRVLLLVFWAST